MRLGLVLAAAAAVFVPSLSLAADRVCTDIALLSPASGQHFIGTRPIHFSWSGEPVGTVTRELHLAALDGSEVVVPLDGRFSDTVKVKMTGDLGWAVVFKDADGKVLCISPAGLIAAGAGGGKVAEGASASLSGTVAGSPSRLVVGFTNNGRLVIVLQNTPYTGQYSKLILADSYDLTNEDLMGASGVEFHGNNVGNVVTGSPGNDLIWLYDGNDEAEGGLGNDILVGGPGNDTLRDFAGGGDADVIYLGPGSNDYGGVTDGDTNDLVYSGSSTVFGLAGDNLFVEAPGVFTGVKGPDSP